MTALSTQLDRDSFLVSLISEITGVLQSVMGVENAAAFVTAVADNMGNRITEDYARALKLTRLDKSILSAVMVDLKRRIAGDFYVIEETAERIVLGNRRCPYGKMVEGRPTLCMMTSNIFGRMASSSTGYAKVQLLNTIANGAAGCKVVVYLQPTLEAEQASGTEYFDDNIEITAPDHAA